MTRFLASVANPDEAAVLLAAGADIVDIKDPRKGALGAVDTAITREIVQKISGRVMTSATIGDLPMVADDISAAIQSIHTTGVDIIKVGIFAPFITAEIMQILNYHTNSGCRIVLVFFADLGPANLNFFNLAKAGVYGVMLDTADKTKGSLRSILDDQVLNEFVSGAQQYELLTGLAGSLKLTDIPPLLKFKPDYLGFRSALCDKQQRRGSIDARAVHNVRAMIPMHHGYADKNNSVIANI